MAAPGHAGSALGAVKFARQADGFSTVAFYDEVLDPNPALALWNGDRMVIISDDGGQWLRKIAGSQDHTFSLGITPDTS